MMRNRRGLSPDRARGIGIALAAFALTSCGALLTNHYRIERAQREMQAGEWQGAAFDLRTVVRKDPHNAKAWVLLARLSLDAADANGAQSALQHALAAGAKGPQVEDLQARIWLANDQAKRLLDALAKHAIALPEPDRSVLSVRALLGTGQLEQAMAVLQPLVAAHPNLTEARDLLAVSLASQGHFPAALAQLAVAAQRDPKSPEPHLIAGRIDAATGQFAAAEHAMLAALQRMPGSEPILHRLTALVTLTESRLALGQGDLAAKSLAALTKLEPQSPLTMLLQARVKLARGALLAGTNELERVVLNAPQFVQARLTLGAALIARGELEQAEQQLQQALTQAPGNIAARKLLAQVQLKLGNPGAAIRVLTPALSAPKLDPQLLSLLGSAAESTGDREVLIRSLERSAQAHPDDTKILINLAAVYLSVGQPQRALTLLEKTTDRDGVRRDQLLVSALLATRGPGAAGKAVQQLLAAHPHSAPVLELGASYFATQNDLTQTRALLREALAIRPDDLGAVVALAQIDERAGDVSAAESRLKGALAAHPEALPVRIALADVLAGARQFAQAHTVLAAARDAQKQPEVQFALAGLALVQDNLPEANAALDRAVAAQPGSAILMEHAGLMLLGANQYDAALARLARAAAREPGNATYWLNVARAQLDLNRPLAAYASLEKASRLQPHWLPAARLLALIDLHQGKSQAALDRAKAFLAGAPHDPGALVFEGDVEGAVGQMTKAVAAYREAQRWRPSAAVAVKLYQAQLAAHLPNPAQPLEQWLQRWPQDWRVRTVLGDYDLTVARNPRKAVREFSLAVKQNAGDAVALNNLAWAMNRIHDPHAEAMAERAYQVAPNSPQINDTLGWILMREGQGPRALGYLEQATRLDPQDPQLQYHYAYALAKTGRSAQARKILLKILSSPRPFDGRPAAQRLLATLKV